MMAFFMAGVQRPKSTRSFNKYLFTMGNSPESTRRMYMFEVNGSKHSLFPKIWAVEAVGMGAIKRELRMPYFRISSRNTSHSQRPEGFTFHMSNWKIPLDMGEPSYELYGPSSLAMSLEEVSAA